MKQTEAHKEVINSLKSFVAQLDVDSQIAKLIRIIITAYRNEVDTFLSGFDIILDQKDKAVATWASSEAMRKSTPRLIMMLTELIMMLSRISSNTHALQSDDA